MNEHDRLMDRICEKSNLNQAFRRVKKNKGSAGIDRKTIAETEAYLYEPGNARRITEKLLSGSYHPQLVRGVKIPKPSGGERQLGIPTVIDRMIQQALLQVLTPIYEPQFSSSSYGFRPGKSAHDALKSASKYVESGNHWVVDLDLEKFFDHVNHDRLIHRLSKNIKDKRVLQLIGRYLRAGLLQDGVVIERQSGTPQGGPLSPLLSNIVLDELDKELESRGHKFCRYADDCNIYVASQRSGERVLASISEFIENKLKLKVNTSKSACAQVQTRQFLGYRLLNGGKLSLSPETQSRFKKRIRRITKRNRGRSLVKVIEDLNVYLRGWIQYFKLTNGIDRMEKFDGWIRRRLRCYRLKQRKRSYPIAKWLQALGVDASNAWRLAKSSKGWWRKSRNPTINMAMPNAWFDSQGLLSLTSELKRLKVKSESPYA